MQFGVYVRDFVTGDWGDSLRTRRPVLGEILHYLPPSLEIIIAAMILASVVGTTIGSLTARMNRSWIDHLGRVFSIAGVSLPGFYVALLLQITFFRILGILPVAGQADIALAQSNPVDQVTGMLVLDALLAGNFTIFLDALQHLVLPVLALAAYPTGVVMRMTRSAMLETLETDYIRMSRAMGVPGRTIVLRYGLKNAAAPMLTVIGLMFAYALVGTFFVELIFAWPGLGTYATNSMLSLDYPAIMGVTVMVALMYVIVNLLVDLAIAKIDPRIILS